MRVTPIQKGDAFGIFSPSEPITDERKTRLDRGIRILQDRGFLTVLSPNAFAQSAYTAGTVDERVDDFHQLLKDDKVAALLASWGGKSCNQLLDKVDYELVRKYRKPVFAFSDGCVLLNALAAQSELFTFHGPNVAGKLFETQHADFSLLGKESESRLNLLGNVQHAPTRVIRSGKSQGRLFGGNLSTFVLGLVGSPYMPAWNPSLFFWESASETPQIVHQHLTCLRNAGVFDRVTGMIIGSFIVEEPSEYKKRDPFEMIIDAVGDYQFPILYCPTFGHPSHLENPILPIGAMCQLDSDLRSLILLERLTDI